MKTRELKFRVWVSIGNCFSYFNIYEGANLGIAGGVSEPQQFTGMLDNNGKEIYEGDIIRGYFDMGPAGMTIHTGIVKWDDLEGYQWKYWDLNSIEVVGNIFENENEKENDQAISY